MKPGKNDKRYKIRVEGLELEILQRLTFAMTDDFGLGRRIEAYKGTRAITLYSWDLDCLEAVTDLALKNPAAEDIRTEQELLALRRLDARFRKLHRTGEDTG